ncbi:MAG: hypothetical protein CMI54_07520 [Parcubacteria group bacterium]|nr:hypothetical protein [Parcubacteria group bacterium]
MDLVTSKDCRNAYREILQGYTYIEEENFYIKHFKESDLGFIEYIYKRCEEDIKELGVPPLKEKLEFLNKEKYWTEQEEIDYNAASLAVSDAYSFRLKLHDPRQKESFQATIEAQEKLLEEIRKERHALVEPTIETYCDKKINEQYIQRALYKDESLKEPFYTKEEFEVIPYSRVAEIVGIYNKSIEKFKDKNIKRIAVNSFFLNAFLMSENNPVRFYGHSVLEMTVYQMNLFSRGKYYKSILEEGKSPPDNIYEQVEAEGVDCLVMFYEMAFNQIQAERQREISKMKAQAAKSGRR